MDSIFKILDSNWRPALEIATLAVGIYYGFVVMRKTRAWPVVVGFGVLAVVTLVATLLELKVLQWLFLAFFAISTLAILVIFQPELRRMLAELGNLPLFVSVREQREKIEVIVETVERLA